MTRSATASSAPSGVARRVRRGIVLSVVLGEDGPATRVQDDFRASGLYHLLASGQERRLPRRRIWPRLARAATEAWRELSILTAIAVYVLAVGWQPSVVRAGVAGSW